MNLTAITEPAEVAELHLFDSLTLLDVLPDYFWSWSDWCSVQGAGLARHTFENSQTGK